MVKRNAIKERGHRLCPLLFLLYKKSLTRTFALIRPFIKIITIIIYSSVFSTFSVSTASSFGAASAFLVEVLRLLLVVFLASVFAE